MYLPLQQQASTRLSPAEAEARLQLLGHMLAPERVPSPRDGKHFSSMWLTISDISTTGSSGSPSPKQGLSQRQHPPLGCLTFTSAPSPWRKTPHKAAPPQVVHTPPNWLRLCLQSPLCRQCPSSRPIRQSRPGFP
jgi:hypothetical protein